MDDAVPATRPQFEPPIDGGIVVGVDGSPASDQVLAWALREAAAHGGPLHVVRAWSLRGDSAAAEAPFGIVPSLAECRAAVVAETRLAVERARDGTDDGARADAVHVHAVHGPAGDALVEASRTATVLVVGHRGQARWQLLLGSVTQRVLAQAGCPVVVVRLPAG